MIYIINKGEEDLTSGNKAPIYYLDALQTLIDKLLFLEIDVKEIKSSVPLKSLPQTLQDLINGGDIIFNQLQAEAVIPLPKKEKKEKKPFSFPFARKKKEAVQECVQPELSLSFIQSLTKPEDNFKDVLRDTDKLTEEQLTYLRKRKEELQRAGTTCYFIELARKEKLLTEDDSAQILTGILKTEVISKSCLNPNELLKLNKKNLETTKHYFIYKIDGDSKKIYVIKDAGVNNVDYDYIYRNFIDYEIVETNVVDGIIKELREELNIR